MNALRPAAALALVAVATTPATAQSNFVAATADLMKVCIAALIAPGELQTALDERKMADVGMMHLPPGWDGVIYGTDTGGRRAVTIGHQRYSDLQVTNCTVVVAASASYDDLVDLKALLEQDPHIGKLEGRIITATPTIKLANFKRPGNAPIVTYNFTTSATSTSLVMSRMDLQPES
jgi:hypothetical protein